MESTCHRGTDLIPVTKEGRECSMCGQRKPPTLTGYRCRCGNKYDKEGARIQDVPKEEPAKRLVQPSVKSKKGN